MTQERASGVFLGLLAQMVEARSGLHHHRDLDLFSERVSARALEAGFESLVDYYYLLRYDDPASAELDRLIETLVVNETFFFRESPPLHALVDTLAPMVHAGRRPRVWSAACATGEEPVTLTVMLEQAGLGGKVDIVATDISHRVLERARRGDYGLRAHRAIPDGLPPWIRIERDRAVVDERIRKSIDWRWANLADAASLTSLGVFDAILCRNVFIYFSDETVRRVASHLLHALQPGGRVIVGVSESLLRFGTSFECEERGGAFLYRRAER